jgi:hypothetical protein
MSRRSNRPRRDTSTAVFGEHEERCKRVLRAFDASMN